MYKSLSWIIKNVLVPLIPTVAGLMIRCFEHATFSFEYFEYSELAFSMSLLCLLVMEDAKKLSDSQLGNIIHGIYLGLFVIFMVAFVKLVSEQYDVYLLKETFLNEFESITSLDRIKTLYNELVQDMTNPSATIEMIKGFSFWLSILGVFGAIFCHIKFKLAD